MLIKRIARFISDQIVKNKEGGLFLLTRNLILFLLTPFLVLIVLFIRLLRPLILIRFGELISSRIGHFAANTEVYLCERDLGMHGRQRSLDIFYINSPICNRQLMKMWSRALCISHFAIGLDLINRVLPGGGKHKIQWRLYQSRDIYGILESTKAHIAFTIKEDRIGQELLKKIGITSGSLFVCFLSRDPAYLDTVMPKINTRYHDYRNSDIKNFIPAAEELTRRGYFAVRMGAIVKEPLKITNPRIIDYATKHRTEFLDIFLGAKCRFFLSSGSGIDEIAKLFRKPVAYVNCVPLEYANTWCSDHVFIPKKLWLKREKRLLTFREILGSEVGRFIYSKQYEQMGIEVIENTPEEITSLAVEMDQRLKGEWRASEGDDELQKRFWALFKPSEFNRVFRSRIGAEFLRQNTDLLKI